MASPRGNAKGESNTNETVIAQIKAERGLRTLLNLAVENKDSIQSDVVACQARLAKLLALLTESSMLLSLFFPLFSSLLFSSLHLTSLPLIFAIPN
jgi:hypothetical protein